MKKKIKLARAKSGDSRANLPRRPTKARQHLERAYECQEQAEFEQALRECEAAIALAPSLAEAHNLAGIVLEELGHPDQALPAYARAVELDPGFQNAAKNLAEVKAEFTKGKRLVTIAHYSHVPQAYVFRTKLQAAGIWSFVADESTVTVFGILPDVIGGVRLMVRAPDVDRALRILGQEPYDPARKSSGPHCPRCGSFDVHYEKYALRRVFAALLILRAPLPFYKRKWKCRDCANEWQMEAEQD